MAVIAKLVQTFEDDGVNCICEFDDTYFQDKTHKDGEKIMAYIAEEFYPILKAQHLRKLKNKDEKDK